MELKNYITTVPDYPVKGVSFKDISPLLANIDARNFLIEEMVKSLGKILNDIDYIAGMDARGFIFGSLLAQRVNKGFLMIRKKDKLPPPFSEKAYKTEYSEEAMAVKQGHGKVLIVDDVLATGGTLHAAMELLEQAGYETVGAMVAIDLKPLHGEIMPAIKKRPIILSIINYYNFDE